MNLIVNKARFCLLLIGVAVLPALCEAQVRISDLQNYSTTYSTWGVKAGGNFQLLGGFPFQQDYSKGFLAGAYAQRREGPIEWQAEVNMSTASFKTTNPVACKCGLTELAIADTTSKGDFSAIYLNVPLMVKLRPGKHLMVNFGVQYTHMLSITDNNGAFTKQFGTEKVLKPDNVFMLTGLEVDLTKKLRLGATYSLGFANVNNHKYTPLSDTWMVSNGQVFLTYSIKKWGIKI